MEFERDLLGSALKDGLVEIKFTKVNGDPRTMRCTLNEEYIPDINKAKGSEKKKSAEVLPVYEIDNGWRSFRWNSLKSWHKIQETWR